MSPNTTAHRQRRLRTDVFLTLGGQLLTLVLGLIITIIIARELGLAGRGILAVSYSLMLILVQFGSFGLVSANPYFASRDPTTVPRIVTNSVWFAIVLGGLLIPVGIAIKLWLPTMVPGIGWVELLIALAGIPAALSVLLFQGILLGQGRMVAYNTIEVLQGALAVAGLIIGFSVFNFHEAGALAVLVTTTYATAIAFISLLLRHELSTLRPYPKLAIEMLKYGFRVYVAALLAFLVIRLDLLLVNAYLGPTQAGLYSIVAAIASGLYLIPLSVALNLFPRVARGTDYRMTAEVFRSFSVLYALICLISLPLAAPGIRFLFGDNFSGAITLFYWILPGIFSLGMLNILSYHFAGRGFPLNAVLVWIPGLALNIIINIVFLSSQGTYIASLSSSISYVLILILHIRVFTQESGDYRVLRPHLAETIRFVKTSLGN